MMTIDEMKQRTTDTRNIAPHSVAVWGTIREDGNAVCLRCMCALHAAGVDLRDAIGDPDKVQVVRYDEGDSIRCVVCGC